MNAGFRFMSGDIAQISRTNRESKGSEAMHTAFLAVSTALAMTAAAAPALAGHDRHHSRDWREDRRDLSRAYREGYRDGLRADSRRDRYRGQAYSGPQTWQFDAYPSRWDNAGYGPENRTPVYRTTSAGRSQPYWWGANGQVHCRRADGTTGLVVGALAGGTRGNVLAREGDKRLGSVIGGTLGAVLGNEIAKGSAGCR
jgi:hypothetical protein